MEEKQVIQKGRVSNIGWTCFTWNIAVGCDKVSEGCKNCYMMRDGEKYGDNRNGVVRRTKPPTFNRPLTEWRNAPAGYTDITDTVNQLSKEQIDIKNKLRKSRNLKIE